MKKRESFLPIFLVVAFFSTLILAFSLSGNLKFLSSFLEKGTSGIQPFAFGIFYKLPFVATDSKIKELENENLELLSRISDFEKLKRENDALSDQFQTQSPQSSKLLKADIIGAPGFVPGISGPNYFVLNKGLEDNLEVGHAVIVKNNLIGIVSDVSANLSKVNIINNPAFSFTGKTINGALGVVKSEGGSLTLDNVQLWEDIKVDEIVLTSGDIDPNGIGVPADLVVGKITSIEKNPSDLFQKAKIESFVNLVNLSTVFVYIGID